MVIIFLCPATMGSSNSWGRLLELPVLKIARVSKLKAIRCIIEAAEKVISWHWIKYICGDLLQGYDQGLMNWGIQMACLAQKLSKYWGITKYDYVIRRQVNSMCTCNTACNAMGVPQLYLKKTINVYVSKNTKKYIFKFI